MQIVKCGTTKFKPSYLYNEHFHSHYEIIYIESGQCLLSIDNKEVGLNVGNCIIINQNVAHNFFVNGSNGCKINQLEIEADLASLDTSYIKLSDASYVDSSINHIALFNSESIYKKHKDRLVNLEFEKMVLLLDCNQDKRQNCNDSPIVDFAINYIKNHYNTDFNITELNEKIGLSGRYIRKIFEQKIGVTPIEYMINLRMQKAKWLLSSTCKTIGEVAMEVGYNTIQYFSEIFKRRTGITPKNFRKTVNGGLNDK